MEHRLCYDVVFIYKSPSADIKGQITDQN